MALKRRLSQTLGQIKKGFAVDTFEGGFPVQQFIKAADAESNTAVHANIPFTTAEQEVLTGITAPDVYRCLLAKGDHASVSGILTIQGTDWADRIVEEQFTLSGTAVVSGTRPFKDVLKITVPAQGVAAHNVSVGITKALGLYRPVASGQSTNTLLKVDGVVEAIASIGGVQDDYTRFVPTTAPNGTRLYEVAYVTDIF